MANSTQKHEEQSDRSGPHGGEKKATMAEQLASPGPKDRLAGLKMLYDAVGEDAYRLLLKRGLQSADCLDVIQSAMMEMVCKVLRGPIDRKQSAPALFFAIVRNKRCDKYRGDSREDKNMRAYGLFAQHFADRGIHAADVSPLSGDFEHGSHGYDSWWHNVCRRVWRGYQSLTAEQRIVIKIWAKEYLASEKRPSMVALTEAVDTFLVAHGNTPLGEAAVRGRYNRGLNALREHLLESQEDE